VTLNAPKKGGTARQKLAARIRLDVDGGKRKGGSPPAIRKLSGKKKGREDHSPQKETGSITSKKKREPGDLVLLPDP